MQLEILPVTRYAMNCSILWCERTGRAAVIDPGGNLDEIIDLIELLDLQVDVALVTHAHHDHCGGAAKFAERTGARIEGPHKADAPTVARLDEFGARFGVPAQPYVPARWLEHGDSVAFGEERLEVLHCPGHSPGHVAYFSPTRRQAFVGDILFRGSIGAWEHPQGNLPQLIDSIRYRLFPLGDDVAFVPGHGECSYFGYERQHNPFVGDEAFAQWCAHFSGTADPALREG